MSSARSAGRYARRSIHPRGASSPRSTSVAVIQPNLSRRRAAYPVNRAWTASRWRRRSARCRASRSSVAPIPSADSTRSTTSRSRCRPSAFSIRQTAAGTYWAWPRARAASNPRATGRRARHRPVGGRNRVARCRGEGSARACCSGTHLSAPLRRAPGRVRRRYGRVPRVRDSAQSQAGRSRRARCPSGRLRRRPLHDTPPVTRGGVSGGRRAPGSESAGRSQRGPESGPESAGAGERGRSQRGPEARGARGRSAGGRRAVADELDETLRKAWAFLHWPRGAARPPFRRRPEPSGDRPEEPASRCPVTAAAPRPGPPTQPRPASRRAAGPRRGQA